jgi:hypothetical protein
MAAAPFLLIAGAAMSAIGALSAASAQKNAADYNADVAKRNALIARQQASANEAAQRRDASRALGKMRAGYGASGVVGSEGTPLDVLEDSVATAELDALNIRYSGELEAMGYQDEARLQKMRGKAAMREGYFKAGSAILGGMSSYAGMTRTG